MDYFTIGSANFVEDSQKHKNTIPKNSLQVSQFVSHLVILSVDHSLIKNVSLPVVIYSQIHRLGSQSTSFTEAIRGTRLIGGFTLEACSKTKPLQQNYFI